MTEVYIDGHKMELGKIKFLQVYQINDVGEPKDRQLNYTLPFYFPETPNNVIAFEMLGVIGNTSTIPYKRLPVKVVENGVEVIPDGIIAVSGKQKKGFKAHIYGGNVFLFDAIGSKKVNELDLSSVNHSVSEENFVNSFDNDEGYVYAISDFGKFRPDTEGIEVNYQVPSIFVHTLWSFIFNQSNVEFHGDIFQDDKFKKLLLTTHRGYNSEVDVINDPINVTMAEQITQLNNYNNWVFGSTPPPQVFIFLVYPAQANVLGTLIQTTQSGVYTFNLHIDVNINDVDLNYQVYIKMYKPSGNIFIPAEEVYSQNIGELVGLPYTILGVNHPTNLSLNLDVSGEVFLEDNTDVYITIEYHRLLIGNESTTIFNQTITDFVFTNNVALTTLSFNSFLGDLSQIAFIKDVMQHFGLIFQKRKNKLAYDFIRIADLIADRTNTLDWSDKLVGDPPENYKLSRYAQSNRFAYHYLEADSVRFSDGLMKINNENLPSERTLVQRPYNAPTISETQLLNEDITYTPFWKVERNDDGTIKNYKPFSSKNYFVEKKMVNGTVNYGLTGNTNNNSFTGDVPIMDFSNLSYDQLLSENYTELNKALDFNFVITAELLLDELDIQDLDLFKTIFLKQYSADFYINKIKYVDSSLPSKVELVKIKR